MHDFYPVANSSEPLDAQHRNIPLLSALSTYRACLLLWQVRQKQTFVETFLQSLSVSCQAPLTYPRTFAPSGPAPL